MDERWYINGRVVAEMPDGCGSCPLLDKDDSTVLLSDGYCVYLKKRKKRYAKLHARCRHMFVEHFEKLGIKHKNP